MKEEEEDDFFANFIDVQRGNNEYCRVFEQKDKEGQFGAITQI